MELELFAQINQNSAAYSTGRIFGIIVAVLLSAAIPISFGASRGQPVLGVVGSVLAVPAAFFLGCLGGLPVALLFVGIIAFVNSEGRPRKKKRKKKPRQDEDDDYDRPRRSRRADDDEDGDYDDRPRRSRRDDEDDDRPRRSRRDDEDDDRPRPRRRQDE